MLRVCIGTETLPTGLFYVCLLSSAVTDTHQTSISNPIPCPSLQEVVVYDCISFHTNSVICFFFTLKIIVLILYCYVTRNIMKN